MQKDAPAPSGQPARTSSRMCAAMQLVQLLTLLCRAAAQYLASVCVQLSAAGAGAGAGDGGGTGVGPGAGPGGEALPHDSLSQSPA